VPLYQDNYIDHDDFKYFGQTICSENDIQEFKANHSQNVNKECLKLCPKDCYSIEYYWDLKPMEIINKKEWYEWYNGDDYLDHINFSLIFKWDQNSPVYIYKETQTLSFTDYLCYCGGLFSLWFGSNAKDLIIWLIKSQILISIMHLFKLISNYINKIYLIIFGLRCIQ